MTERRICNLTMVGGVVVIGDLVTPDDWPSAELRNPCIIQMNGNNVTLINFLRDSPIHAGDSVDVNMRTVMWISAAPPALLEAYHRSVSTIIMPKSTDVRLNQ